MDFKSLIKPAAVAAVVTLALVKFKWVGAGEDTPSFLK